MSFADFIMKKFGWTKTINCFGNNFYWEKNGQKVNLPNNCFLPSEDTILLILKEMSAHQNNNINCPGYLSITFPKYSHDIKSFISHKFYVQWKSEECPSISGPKGEGLSLQEAIHNYLKNAFGKEYEQTLPKVSRKRYNIRFTENNKYMIWDAKEQKYALDTMFSESLAQDICDSLNSSYEDIPVKNETFILRQEDDTDDIIYEKRDACESDIPPAL